MDNPEAKFPIGSHVNYQHKSGEQRVGMVSRCCYLFGAERWVYVVEERTVAYRREDELSLARKE